MKLRFSPHFSRSYAKAPLNVQRAFDNKIVLLVENPRHPSLRAKKYDEAAGLWQARVNQDWRFYFTIEGDTFHLHDIRAHPK